MWHMPGNLPGWCNQDRKLIKESNLEKAILIELLPTGLKMTTEKLMGGAFHKKIDEVSDIIRFDEDFYATGTISDEKFNECVKVLQNYANLAKAKGVTNKIYAYASSMFQEIIGSKKFIDDIFKKTSIFFNVLSVEEEHRLVYNAVVGTIETVKGVILYVNPHNTYVMNFAKRSLMTTYTLPFGSNSLAHKFKHLEGQDAKKVAQEMVSFVKAQLRKQNIVWEEFEEVRFVGAGSMFLALSKLVRKQTRYPLDYANNYYLTTENTNKAFDLLLSQGFNRNKRLPNISNERLDNLIAGVAIIKAFSEEKEVEMFNIAGRTITEALVNVKIVRESSCEGTPNDLMETSLKNIKYYYPIDESNADNVYTLTIELFHQLSIVHKLSRKHVRALKVATYMYDCGKRVNFDNHSLYSKEIILNSDILNINHKDLVIAAFSCQMQNMDNFKLEEWVKYRAIVDEEDLVCARKIAGLISLAAALDRGKQNKIKEISCDLLGDIVIIKAKTDADASYEISEANKINNVFKKIFNKTYQIM